MNVFISALVSFLLVIGALNVPAHWFNLASYFHTRPTLGSAFTTVAGSNNLSAFPALYNANLGQTANTTTPNSWSGLQQFQGNASTTGLSAYLAWFGQTATSSFSGTGALTLATPLLPASGGTGSTTLSSNQVLLGNGTGNIKTVTGWGTNQYALVSNGGTSAPTWQAQQTDQTANYTWTGSHIFASSTSYELHAGNIEATSTIKVGGLTYSSLQATTTGMFIQEDGDTSAKVIQHNLATTPTTISIYSTAFVCDASGAAGTLSVSSGISTTTAKALTRQISDSTAAGTSNTNASTTSILIHYSSNNVERRSAYISAKSSTSFTLTWSTNSDECASHATEKSPPIYIWWTASR